MQLCLTSSKKILDGFEVADKKDLTPERMSGIVADTIVRIYDTNLAKLDGLALKTWYFDVFVMICYDKYSHEAFLLNYVYFSSYRVAN